MTYCRFRVCPRCKQDALFVMKRHGIGTLYLHCEECEWAWNLPEDVKHVERGFLGLDIDGEYATQEEVAHAGWLKHGIQCTTSK